MSHRRFYFSFAVSLIAFGWVPPAASQPQGAVDLHGDPLPAGAVARLGTDRFSHSDVNFLEFSPDGKMLASLNTEGKLRLWEVNTGREIREIQTRPFRSNERHSRPTASSWPVRAATVR